MTRPIGKLALWAELGTLLAANVAQGFAPRERDERKVNWILNQLGQWQYRDGIEALQWSPIRELDAHNSFNGTRVYRVYEQSKSNFCYDPVRHRYAIALQNIGNPERGYFGWSFDGVNWTEDDGLPQGPGSGSTDATHAYYQVVTDGHGHYAAWLNIYGGDDNDTAQFVYKTADVGVSPVGGWIPDAALHGIKLGGFWDERDQVYYFFGRSTGGNVSVTYSNVDNSETGSVTLLNATASTLLFGAGNDFAKVFTDGQHFWVTPNALTSAKRYSVEEVFGEGYEIRGLTYSTEERQFVATTVTSIWTSPNGTYWTRTYQSFAYTTLHGAVASIGGITIVPVKPAQPSLNEVSGLAVGFDSFRRWLYLPGPIPVGSDALLYSVDGRIMALTHESTGAVSLLWTGRS